MYKDIKIDPIQAIDLGGQIYNSSDTSLISSFDNQTYFDTGVDFIEYFIYDRNKNLLTTSYQHTTYQPTPEGIALDPIKDLEATAYTAGSYYTIYNFVRPLVNSSFINRYYISEISADRTEIRLNSNTIAPSLIIDGVTSLQLEIQSTSYYKDFYLNLGFNELFIANNIAVDYTDLDNPSVLIKLYEPLPDTIATKTECWVVDKIGDSVAYALTIQDILTNLDEKIYLKSANFTIPVANTVNNSTEYKSLSSLYSSPTASLTTQLKSLLVEKGAQLNIDYTDYNNFAFFSSVESRLENFAYKLQLLEQYEANKNIASGVLPSIAISASENTWETKINDIILNFDDYEYFLYYTSGSKSWPKNNSSKPYENTSTTSSIALSWLTEQLTSASYYDQQNNNALKNNIPLYLLEDDSNINYTIFIDMIGQHFDVLYSYTNAITEKYNADNRADYGISKDLIAEALRDLGVKLYESNLTDANLYNTYLGVDLDGNPTVNTGSEVINNIVIPTLSSSSIQTPLDAYNLLTVETYKRLYHNLPYLLKKKGTVEGLSTLINCFGIPDTLLQVNQLGNKDRNDLQSWNYWKDAYNYAATTSGSGYIEAPWLNLTPTNTTPKTIEFRFKTPGIPTQFSQSLLTVSTGSNYLGSQQFAVVLEYTGSGNISGSYEGSIPSPYREYGTVKLLDLVNNISTSIYLPVFNGDWWSVMLTEQSEGVNYRHTLYVKNKPYSGPDGNILGFQASGSTTGTAGWINQGYSGSNSGGLRLGNNTNITLLSKTYTPVTASFQELRYYTLPLMESTFNDYVMNPTSIEGSSLTGLSGSQNILLFRAPLGTDLRTETSSATYNSIHPAFSTIPSTASFTGPLGVPVNSYRYVGIVNYPSNVETIFYTQPNTGLRDINSVRVKQQTTQLPTSGDNLPPNQTLSPYIRVQQDSYLSSSVGLEINSAEIAFSPQNEINKDIVNELGYFNIGEYIGDPRSIRDSKYTELEDLKNSYFSKYQHKYNYKDYIRIIRYYNNLLFKIIKDFTPVRSSITTGVIIKQTLLERDKYVTPLPVYEDIQYTASIQPFPYSVETGSIESISGDSGGIYDSLTSSFNETYKTPEGPVTVLQNSNKEFYTGELNDTEITATTQSLLDNPLLSSSFVSGVDAYSSTLYKDYLADLNNVSSSRLSTKFFNLDYNAGSTTPLNLNNILNGSSTYAEVEDSNYNMSSSYAKVRYVGKQQTVAGVNLGKEIIVGSQRSYMAYYDWASSTLAEKSGSANFHIMYLIDEEGNIEQPTSDINSSPYLPNLTQNFSERSTVNVITYKPQLQGVGNEIIQTTSVVRPAKTLTTILYSDTGSNGLPYLGTGYKTTLQFAVPPGVYNKPFGFGASGGGTEGSSTFGFTASFQTVFLDEASGWNSSSNTYTVQETVPVRAVIDVSFDIENMAGVLNPVDVYLYKNSTRVASASVSITDPGTWTPSLQYNTYLQQGDVYYAIIQNNGTINYTSNFYINPLTASINVTAPYFTTGSNYTSVLTSSIALGALYGYYQQTPVVSNGTGSGFSNPELLTIQRGDEIRFEGKENKSYMVISSSFDPTTQKFYLFLNTPLYTAGTNIQYFSIRRYKDDPGLLILESPNTVSPTGPGFIVPDFMSDKLKANYSAIIKDFAQKNLI